IYLCIVRPFDLQHAQSTLVEGTENGVIDQDKRAWDVHLELNNRCTASRDDGGLDIFLAYSGTPFSIDPIEDLADNMERRHQIGPAIAHEQTHGFSHSGLEGVITDQGIHGAIEHHIS